MSNFHTPVLLQETLDFLKIEEGKKYIDATVGGGGHAVEILKRGGFLLGLDADPNAIEEAKKQIKSRVPQKDETKDWRIERGNFREIEKIAKELEFFPVAGVLYDLGLSSFQIGSSGKGFSFLKNEPLDMRADPTLNVMAADLINGLTEYELAELFKKYGEDPNARRIARVVCERRSLKPITTSGELTDLIVETVGKKRRINPATQVFQALRIAVNDEINNLQSSLPQAFELLDSGGRLVVISFHSLEDRVVKNFFKNIGQIVTPKPITPSHEEVTLNPRSRSAKLRVLEKRK